MSLLKRFLVILLALIVLSACSAGECREQDASCVRVLFIGNSYTLYNDMPTTFTELAKAGKHNVHVEVSAQGGWSLADHVQSAETLGTIRSQKWNYVVLQEQSQIPALQDARTDSMYPAARTLVQQVRNVGATPLFFLTWAHRNGFAEYGMSYEGMQSQLNNGYYGISIEVNAPVAPAGTAWQKVVTTHPEITLWQEDGSHPTAEGSYLAACVFYAAIFEESATGLSYRAGLSKEVAETLQSIASETVLGTP
jgi:hypothetical protein